MARFRQAIEEQNARFPEFVKLLDDPKPFLDAMRTLMALLAGHSNLFIRNANPRPSAETIRQLLEFCITLPIVRWTPVLPFDTNRPVEENLKSQEVRHYAYSENDRQEHHRDIETALMDVLTMMGQLSHAIRSVEMQRLLRCILDVRHVLSADVRKSHDEAVRLTDEIVYLWDSLHLEIELMSEREQIDLVYPEIPKHEPDLYIDYSFPSGTSADEATEICRDDAFKQYNERNFELLPHKDLLTDKMINPMPSIRDSMLELASNMESKVVIIDVPFKAFDYDLLKRALLADLSVGYEEYEEIEDGDDDFYHVTLEHHPTWEYTDEHKAQQELITATRRYLNAAVALAKEIDSDSYEKWNRMNVIFEKYGGHFSHVYGRQVLESSADVKEFVQLMRPARQQLWSDWEAHKRAKKEPKPSINVHLDESSQKRIEEGRGKQLANMAQDIHALVENTKSRRDGRKGVIALLQRVYALGKEGRIKNVGSWPDVVDYIKGVKTPNDPFYEECCWARSFVAALYANKKKKSKFGLAGVWASLSKQSMKSYEKRSSHEKKGESLAPVPTLNEGVEYLANGLGNN